MRDGLFKKYFTIFLVTLLSCTGLLGFTLLAISGANYTSEKEKTMSAIAARYEEMAAGILDRETRAESCSEMLGAAAENDSIEFVLTDFDGNMVFRSEPGLQVNRDDIVKAIASIKKNGKLFSAEYFSGLFMSKGNYVCGIPVRSAADTPGYLFLLSSIRPLFSYLGETMATYAFSVGIMLLVAFVVIYTTTTQLISPLQEMSKAAENFGKGDFSARINVEGDDEIAMLARSFNKMADSLEELETNRRNFIANVSHDLRTPMTTIGGYIDGILDGTIPKSEQKHYLEIVSEEVKRLSRLTSSLLSVMRLEESNQSVELTNVEVWNMILNVMFNLEQRIEEKKIYIPDLDPQECEVKADKDMLHQVIYNLMDNAVKYTPIGGEINVSVNESEGKTSITVRNSGQGISEEEQPYVFERFYKTDKSRGIDRGGTGLGLYIVKMLTLAMGGTVDLESDGESYTQFTVTLQSAPLSRDRNSRTVKPEKSKTKESMSVADRVRKLIPEGYSPKFPWSGKH
ncbi:MAG: HAMP domain-containing histidine kinase [Oscillospiraceae bacterium]|nr:HAMP domain-containing histidine kinase [Oscillospiraceae bacterium]